MRLEDPLPGALRIDHDLRWMVQRWWGGWVFLGVLGTLSALPGCGKNNTTPTGATKEPTMTTMTLDPQTTVGQLVTERPSRAKVFEKLGIDYCCGGKKPLAQAAREKGLDPQTVLQVLTASETAAPATQPADAGKMTLTQLADHIEATHHAYLREALPRLSQLALKVAKAHGPNHPWTSELSVTYHELMAELQAHMMKEEKILFPIIRQLDTATGAVHSHCGSINNPIRVMEHEHDNAGQALSRMRELSSDFAAPADACNTFRALLAGLAELEADLHQHIHKENNILFPRAAAREAELNV